MWQSPYREPPKKPPSRVKEIISRATMLILGIFLAWVTVKMMASMTDLTQSASAAATRPTGGSVLRYRNHTDTALLTQWLGVITFGIVTGGLIAAAVLPVGTIQKLFERWYTPPVTGDRGGDSGFHRSWWYWLWP